MKTAALSFFTAITLFAQAPSKDLDMHGDRFRPLKYEEMTPAQKAMTDQILSGDRGSMGGPFNVLLRSPEMGDLAARLGERLRFHSSLPLPLNEFAILIIGRFWNSPYEFHTHLALALKAGLRHELTDAVAAGKRPPSMNADEQAIYNFCMELMTKKQVSDATFNAVKSKFGEQGTVDLIGVAGYYSLVAMILNVDRYPMPEGVQPELKPLR